MQALIRYALAYGVEAQEQGGVAGIDTAPDARKWLDLHVDPVRDPSLITRTVLGIYVPNLVALDPEWFAAHLDHFFPQEDRLRELRDATWDVYLERSAPNLATFRATQRELERDVAELAGRGPAKPARIEALINHLGPLYLHGHLPLDVGLVAAFLVGCGASERAALLKFIGFSFFHWEGPVPPEVLGRARALWEQSVERLTPGSLDAALETAPFGWWFASRKFDDGWALLQLGRALDFCGKLELDFSVAERLADHAKAAPQDALRALIRLIDADVDGWRPAACRKGILATLCVVFASADAGAQELAREFVSRLAARGNPEFLSALPI